MSLLTIVQAAARRIGILKPTAVYTSTDTQVLQLLELSNEVGRELAQKQWQALIKEVSFTTVAAESQGNITTIAPGFNYIINDTIWNRTQRRPVLGPRAPQQWQQMLAQIFSGPFNQFRVRGNLVLFNPTPTASESCYFEYLSKYWCTSANGSTSRDAWGADDDVTLLNEELMIMGLVNRFREAKGLAFDTKKYDDYLLDLLSRDGSKPKLNMGGAPQGLTPGVIVPTGNWPL